MRPFAPCIQRRGRRPVPPEEKLMRLKAKAAAEVIHDHAFDVTGG